MEVDRGNFHVKEEREILLLEWKAIREALVNFGNRRFPQLTLFMVASGFLFKTFLDPNAVGHKVIIAFIGLVLTLLLGAMECLSVLQRRKYVKRAVDIEKMIPILKLMRESRPRLTLALETCATLLVYLFILLVWCGMR